jgi:hypothetical protein
MPRHKAPWVVCLPRLGLGLGLEAIGAAGTSLGDGRASSVGAATAFLGAGALWTKGTVRRGGVGSDTRVLLAGGRGTGVSGETASAGV